MKRSGTAVALPITLLALALLLPLLVARHMQGSQTRGNVARSVRGALLTDLARAAVAEAWWRLERGATDSGDPLYLTLRSGANTPTTLAVEVPHLETLLANDQAMQGCTLADGKVKVTVGPRVPTSVRTREGVMDVRLEARVNHPVGGVYRIIRESREMRLSLAALPQPFDTPSVIVLDALPLVGEQTNQWMEDAVSIINQIVTGVKGAGLSVQGEVPAPLVDDLDREIHRFPAHYVVKSTAAQVPDLTKLFVFPRLEADHKRIEALGPPEGLAGGAASDPQGTLKKASALSIAHHNLLDDAREFQKLWEEVGGKDADNLNALAGQLAPSEWRRRAFLSFAGPGAAKRCTDVLDAYAKEDPSLGVSGVIYVDNKDDTLKFKNRTVKGRLAIIATGAVDLDEVKVGNVTNDLLTIQAEGQMTVKGRIEASLVAHGGLQMGADTVLAGTLVIDHARTGDRYGGKIDLDFNRTHVTTNGLDRPEMFRIGFAPTTSTREMVTE